MNCPYCNKRIEGMTGLMEAAKFQKHLHVCLKNPKRKIISETFELAPGSDFNHKWTETVNVTPHSLQEALELRAASGQ